MTAEPLAAYGLEVTRAKPDLTILAFDPGGTTGYYQGEIDLKTGVIFPNTIRYGQLGPDKHHAELYSMLRMTINSNPHLVIVTEDYIPEFAKAQNYVALEYIGIMQAVASTRVVPFERQPRNIKPYWTREKMQAVGHWPKGKPHAQDAARHWLAFAAKQSRSLHISLVEMIRDAK